jgi:outer membrane protein TolC
MKKRAASIMMASLVLASSFTVYADSVLQPNVTNIVENEAALEEDESLALTYEEALDKALKQSYDYKKLIETIDKLEEVRKQAATDLRYIPIGGQGDSQAVSQLFGLKSSEINLQMSKRQEETLQEMLSFKVRTEYDNIVKKTKEIQLQGEIISNTEKQLKQLNKKSQLGTASTYEYQVQLNKYNEELQKKRTLEKELEDTYLKLNATMGVDKDERYDVVLDREIEWMEEVDLNTHIRRMQSQHPSVWNQEQQIRMNQLDVELHIFNVGGTPYEAKQAETRKSQIELASLKDNIQQSINNTYNQMQQLESQYKMMEVMLEKAEKDLNIVQLRYDVGMAVALDVEMAELAVTSIKNQMETILISYEQLRMIFEKPWLMG